MSDKQIQEIAEMAKIIVSGYAFSIMENGFISILNLEDPSSAMVVNSDAEIIETNMDDIEQKIVLELCAKNLQFMED